MNFENQYLTYEEYKKLGGKLDEMPFNLLEYQAEKEIDRMTLNRFMQLKKYPQELKLCIKSLIFEIDSYNNNDTKVSEKVGDYSVNYSFKTSQEERSSIERIIKSYLSQTKINKVYVLYCGADIHE